MQILGHAWLSTTDIYTHTATYPVRLPPVVAGGEELRGSRSAAGLESPH